MVVGPERMGIAIIVCEATGRARKTEGNEGGQTLFAFCAIWALVRVPGQSGAGRRRGGPRNSGQKYEPSRSAKRHGQG